MENISENVLKMLKYVSMHISFSDVNTIFDTYIIFLINRPRHDAYTIFNNILVGKGNNNIYFLFSNIHGEVWKI